MNKEIGVGIELKTSSLETSVNGRKKYADDTLSRYADRKKGKTRWQEKEKIFYERGQMPLEKFPAMYT